MSGTTKQAPGSLEMCSLGHTGIQVSAVGQGTWAMGAKWGPQDDQESMQTLHHALDLGCRFIDTAQEYGDGRSEQLIGQVFQERGEQVPVGTKVPPIDMNWETTPGVTPMSEKFPAQYLIDRCEVSLRNLRVTSVLDKGVPLTRRKQYSFSYSKRTREEPCDEFTGIVLPCR